MKPGAVRTELGISRDRVARWAGVAEHTAAMYEASAGSLGEDTRSRLDAVYGVLRQTMECLHKLRKGP